MEEINQNDILVTIICTVFNHEKYLNQTIEGFLMQKCNFKFKVYIQDDCSTDNSKVIIQEYEKKYPNIIKGFYLNPNVYNQGISPLFKLLEQVGSEYVAICEGDDFWIDENKLQKQIDFLKKNEDYVASYHNVLVVDDNSKVYNNTNDIMPLYIQHDFTINDIENKLICCSQTASLLFKNFWKDWKTEYKEKFLQCNANGDIKLNTILLMFGKIVFLEDIMSCYRRSYSNDSYTASNYKKNLSYSFIKARKSIEKMIFDIFKVKISFHIEKYVTNSIVIFLKNPSIENFNIVKKCIKCIGPYHYLISILKKFFKRNNETSWQQLNSDYIKEFINE